ncbi:MAG: WG repeat-containing protein [Clostridia bacterium]|nr:WG repeat-containing protein [Clostridia bacterium]
MNKRRKTTLIQLAGLLLCLVCAFGGILLHMQKSGEDSGVAQNLGTFAPENDLTPDAGSEYDPIVNIENVVIPESSEVKKYDYYEYAKNYNLTYSLKQDDYALTSKSYDPADCKVGRVSSGMEFPTEFSLAKRYVDKPVVKKGKRGETTVNESVEEDCPLLLPYYGYVVYTTKNSCMLLDGDLNVIVEDFEGYAPAYMTDYSGNPLFKKDDKYYFYYDGDGYDGAAYTEIENDAFSTMPAEAPGAYKYFAYDMDMLANLFATNDFKNDTGVKGIVYILPEYAGMVEYTVEEQTPVDVTCPSALYNRGGGMLFRFPSYTYTKKEEAKIDGNPYYSFKVSEVLWGYMDADGKVVIEPKYKTAYNFSADGFAVVEDKNSRLCVINKWGNVVYNYFHDTYAFPELGVMYSRDGHYLPDTFGVESTGMLYFDRGYVRMRRKLVDTENGYIDKRDYSTVVDTRGNTLNIPADCSIEGYSDGIMLIKRGDKYGYLNTDGSWVIEPVLSYAKPFSEGLAVMGYTKDTQGVIDTKGNMILYPMYSHIESCSGGVITAYSPVGGWSVFNKMTTSPEAEIINPIVALKERAIAEAKDKFYSQKAAEEETTEDKTAEEEATDELSSRLD